MAMFNCPVAPKCRMTSKFGWRNIGRGREWHQGVDLAGATAGLKVPVYASADGVVKRAGVLSSYGNRVLITHTIGGKTWETNYAHLDKIMVKEGQRVKQGEQIGIMGNTGGSFGVHLHFEIHNGLYAAGQPNAVDPMKYITLESYVAPKKETKPAENTKPVEKDDDIMKFSMDTTKNTVRDFLKQSVDKGYFSKDWLTKFDNGTMTNGDYQGLVLIAEQKRSKEKK